MISTRVIGRYDLEYADEVTLSKAIAGRNRNVMSLLNILIYYSKKVTV